MAVRIMQLHHSAHHVVMRTYLTLATLLFVGFSYGQLAPSKKDVKHFFKPKGGAPPELTMCLLHNALTTDTLELQPLTDDSSSTCCYSLNWVFTKRGNLQINRLHYCQEPPLSLRKWIGSC